MNDENVESKSVESPKQEGAVNEPGLIAASENLELAYIGTKIVKAVPMTEHTFLNDVRGKGVDVGHENQLGYMVIYPDGYKSWSPKAVFENAYRPVSNVEKELIS